jgi:hypothetical protein
MLTGAAATAPLVACDARGENVAAACPRPGVLGASHSGNGSHGAGRPPQSASMRGVAVVVPASAASGIDGSGEGSDSSASDTAAPGRPTSECVGPLRARCTTRDSTRRARDSSLGSAWDVTRDARAAGGMKRGRRSRAMCVNSWASRPRSRGISPTNADPTRMVSSPIANASARCAEVTALGSGPWRIVTLAGSMPTSGLRNRRVA